ncbi:hypothetical protein GCM10009547_18540 [Sporichthya brevicatena]|uniref:Uncharacterized protein n=1 Tax=Sporichthya brevicatena TaxID=171442 RepID=A0ABP3RXS9_9ACTN
MGRQNHPVRPSGRFGFQPVGGMVSPDGHSQWGSILGLPMNMAYAYGTLRAEDGTYWWPIRGSYETVSRRMHLSEARDAVDFVWAPEGEACDVGPVVTEKRDGWTGTWRADGSPVLATNGPEFRWTEPGFLDVHGELVGPAIQFYMPDANEPLVYTSRLFRGSGTIKGQPVRGLFYHDSMHMPADQDFIRSAYITDLQAAWVAFATEFDDGTVHAGHLVWGTEGFDILLIHRTDGESLVLRDLDVAVRISGDYPVEVRYSGGGETWIWTAHPKGYRDPIRADLPEGHRRIQGWVVREGETRRPVHTEALMETYNGRLTDVLM